MSNPKHEPVSEDVEREAFEAWARAEGYPECDFFIYPDRVLHDGTVENGRYSDNDLQENWRGWQARAAAVKPVQDDALGKLCELRDRAANVTLSVIPELANGLFTENYVVSQKHVKHLAELLSYLDRHGVKPAASTGNTEERKKSTRSEMDAITLKAMGDTMQEIAEIVGLPEKEHGDPEALVEAVRVFASPSSPLSEERIYDIIHPAMHLVYKQNKEAVTIGELAESAAQAIAPYLSTGAEDRIASFKARCEAAEKLSVAMSAHTVALIEYSTKQDARVSGLVEALRDTLFCNGHTLTPHVKQKIRVALAALEKGE